MVRCCFYCCVVLFWNCVPCTQDAAMHKYVHVHVRVRTNYVHVLEVWYCHVTTDDVTVTCRSCDDDCCRLQSIDELLCSEVGLYPGDVMNSPAYRTRYSWALLQLLQTAGTERVITRQLLWVDINLHTNGAFGDFLYFLIVFVTRCHRVKSNGCAVRNESRVCVIHSGQNSLCLLPYGCVHCLCTGCKASWFVSTSDKLMFVSQHFCTEWNPEAQAKFVRFFFATL